MGRDASMDWADFAFVSVEDIVMVAEQTAEHGCRGPAEAAGFDAGEEPASELFGIERCDGAVEVDVGLTVGCEEESGFIAGEEQVIEFGEFSRLMMISWHALLVEIYQRDFAGRSRRKTWGSEVVQG